jgi:hypothetical protein
VNLLNPKVQDSAFSKSYLASALAENMDLGYEDDFSYVGSGDSIVPNSLFANLVRTVGGTKSAESNVSSCAERIKQSIL